MKGAQIIYFIIVYTLFTVWQNECMHLDLGIGKRMAYCTIAVFYVNNLVEQ